MSLVDHFVAAKRALQSTACVAEAQRLCSETKRNVIQQQQPSQRVLESVELVSQRLRSVLNDLAHVVVSKELRPEHEESRSLLDFVDSTGADDLLAQVDSGLILDDTKLAVEMERLAAGMAVNLESLIRHFDACNRALSSAEQDREMLAVLASDAAQVDDVVQEIETGLRQCQKLFERLRTRDKWLEEVRNAGDFYETYKTSYEALLREVQRRKEQEQTLFREIQLRQEEESRKREAFRVEHGDYLPADIWEDLIKGPRYRLIIENHADSL